MGKLLYIHDEDGKTYEVGQEVLDQLISDVRVKAGQTYIKTGDAQKALSVFEDDMKNIKSLLGIYKSRLGEPQTPDPKESIS